MPHSHSYAAALERRARVIRKGYIVVTPLAKEIHCRMRALGKSLALHAEVDAALGKRHHNLGTALSQLPKDSDTKRRRLVKVKGDEARHSAFAVAGALAGDGGVLRDRSCGMAPSSIACGLLAPPEGRSDPVLPSCGTLQDEPEQKVCLQLEHLVPAPVTPHAVALRDLGRSPSPEAAPKRRRCVPSVCLEKAEREKALCMPMTDVAASTVENARC
mmetsp:Transcript_77246/g.239998  ORF Transcript_77246/g.239998 Transcript_77246/m.239998 type:complete len:216 (+) Transcript_77246:110-757(+)